MEVSQTLQKAGPADLTRLSLELAARMIYLGKVTATLDEARKLAEDKLMDGSAYSKFKQVVEAQGGNPQALDRFELLPNATGMREILSPRAGFVSAIMAEDIGRASPMMGAGRSRKEDVIDPAVGVILEVKVGEKVERVPCFAASTTPAKRISTKRPNWWKMPSAFRARVRKSGN